MLARTAAWLSARQAELYQQARHDNPSALDQTDPATGACGEAVTLNPERNTTIQAASPRNQLFGSTKTPAFPSRPDKASAMARNAGEERSTAARGHAAAPPASARAWRGRRVPHLPRSQPHGTLRASRWTMRWTPSVGQESG